MPCLDDLLGVGKVFADENVAVRVFRALLLLLNLLGNLVTHSNLLIMPY